MTMAIFGESGETPDGRLFDSLEIQALNVLPMPVIVTIVAIAAYALALKPLGFLPTSFLFLTLMIRFLAGSNLLRAALIAFVSVLVVWLVFRLIFTVLMPPGIVPEAEIIAWVKALFGGKGE